MRVWTIQPREVYQAVAENGVFRCDGRKSVSNLRPYYKWLTSQMDKRIGPAPKGVTYPIWAWYKMDGLCKKPDLRGERWNNSSEGADYACIELEIPDSEILLSDFDMWSVIILDGLISYTEEESKKLEAEYEKLSGSEADAFRSRTWEKAFDLGTDIDSDWISANKWIQGTFWELRKEYVKGVTFFKIGTRKKPL